MSPSLPLHLFSRLISVALTLIGLAAPAPAHAAHAASKHVVIGPITGLPLPRFASLSSDRVNVRSGPGLRYPILWTYVRRDIPVEVVAEFGLYRRVVDAEGKKGWIYGEFLSGRRTVLITGKNRALRADPSATAATVLRAEPGVIGRLKSCSGSWCEIRIAGRYGYMRKVDFFGALPDQHTP